MIKLTCTNCKTVLTIDDGFAGGACRCQYCGTIQHVPVPQQKVQRPATPVGAPAPEPPAAETPVAVVTPTKTLMPGAAPEAASPSGLEELANVVSSSGLAGTGLRSGALRKPRAAAGARNTMIAYIVVGVLALMVVAAVVLVMALRPRGSTAVPGGPGAGAGAPETPGAPGAAAISPQPGAAASPAAVAGPAFMGAPLKGPSVVYLLDRGHGTTETFDAIKGAAAQSIASLGKDIKFQIIFWETDKLEAFPRDSLAYATEDNVAAAKKFLSEIYAFGQSRIGPAMEKAMAQNPAEVVIASGKTGLDDEFVKTVVDLRKNAAAKIHTFALGRGASVEALKAVAEKTGGQFREVTGGALREYADMSP